jgi:hypothetical protein
MPAWNLFPLFYFYTLLQNRALYGQNSLLEG